MLTSNVGYLAIQSVDLNDGAARSPGQIASYLSVVANIGSIILGLLLMRQNRTKVADTAAELASFVHLIVASFVDRVTLLTGNFSTEKKSQVVGSGDSGYSL